jgi:hypothetical protein
MKKGFLVVLLIALISPVFSLNIPENLEGIWEGKDRFVFFENAADDENPQFVIVLKEYYDWYYDRAAEPADYSEKEPRTRNAATHKDPEVIPFTLNQIENILDAYQLTVTYSKHFSNTTTFVIIDDRIFINMYTKYSEIESELNKDITLYRGYQHSDGFVLNSQPVDENIGLLAFYNDKFYDVRYWQTDMDYEATTVTFKYKDDTFLVPKHLFAEGTNYSSVNGRSKKVRNTQPAFLIKNQKLLYNKDKSVLILNDEPYLTKLTDKKTLQDLFQIIKDANSRRKPDPEPIFPVKLPTFPGE